MNDLDLVREMRADAPEPSADQLAAGRDRLRAAIASPTGPARPRPALLRRPVIIAGGLALTAAAATVVVTAGGPGRESHVGPRPSVSAAPVAYVLNQAADAAQARPFTAPRNDQWVYLETRYQAPDKLINGQVQTAGTPLKTHVGRTWTRADGAESATMVGGKLFVGPVVGQPRTDYATLKALPRDPVALLAWVRHEAAAGPRKDGTDTTTFDIFNSILCGLMPPAQEVAVFKALARVPGVTVDRKAARIDGRPALAISHVTEGWLKQELLLDPATYAYLGQRNVVIKDHTEIWSDGTATMKKGAIDVLVTRVAAGVVDRPGQRP